MRLCEARDELCELIDEGLEEPARAVVRNLALGVDEAGLEGDIGLAPHDMRAQAWTIAAPAELQPVNALGLWARRNRAAIRSARPRFDREMTRT